MKRGDLVKYWRSRGGSARAYWLDESRTKDTPLGPVHEVKVKPVVPENAASVWVPIESIYDERER